MPSLQILQFVFCTPLHPFIPSSFGVMISLREAKGLPCKPPNPYILFCFGGMISLREAKCPPFKFANSSPFQMHPPNALPHSTASLNFLVTRTTLSCISFQSNLEEIAQQCATTDLQSLHCQPNQSPLQEPIQSLRYILELP